MKSFENTALAAFLKKAALVLGLCAGLGAAHADDIQLYTGNLDGIPIEVVIEWDHSTGQLIGALDYQGSFIPFAGSNPRSGYIRFIDSDGDAFELRKQLTATRIIWSGLMNGEVPVSFARPR